MDELKAIAEINEEIESIISAAENYTANAMLSTDQTDADDEGLSMVAYELRMYSRKMSAAMQALSDLINCQAEINASKQSRMHNPDLLGKAGAYGGLAQEGIAPTNVDEVERLIVNQVRDLQIMIRRTVKQCAIGLLIARSANIEANPGGAMTPVLDQIVQDVETVIYNIAVHVNKLESSLAELGL